ncbi:MAG: DUF1080 domain-containing protein [Gemmatales bacterium]|nr:DUF1080 domain-containing protein [Gemmatales bacterium]MDW7995474.1 DUF1080 domain-containing protein [Gemmatales bacterium]
MSRIPTAHCQLTCTWFGFLCALAGLVVIASAQDKAKPADQEFISLFNGKDLTGWVYPGPKGKPMDGMTETPDGRFRVRDGAIVAEAKDKTGKGGIRDLYTAQSFDKDFHLQLEFRAAPRADSGVYIRGVQLQVRDYPTVGPYRNLKSFKVGDWNMLDIIVRGKVAECRCNGELLTDKMNVPEKGPIGLQAESGQFEFRNLRLRWLP